MWYSTRTHTKLGMAVAALAFGLVSQSAKAAITNGDFSQSPDLTGWSPIGDVSVQSTDFNPPAPASTLGWLTTRSTNQYGTSPATTNIASLDSAAGLAPGTLEAMSAKTGSVVSQTFSATAGDFVNYNFNFVTNEIVGGNHDIAFYTLRPQSTTTTLNTIATIFDANQTPNPSTDMGESQFGNGDRETGWMSANGAAIGTTGLWTLTYGVINVGDTVSDSALAVTNVAESAVGVPLPAAAYVAPLGMLLAAGYGMKLRRKAVIA